MRKYLLDGGFVIVDDFWDEKLLGHFKEQMKCALPDHEPQTLDLSHQLFQNVFEFNFIPKVPAIHTYVSHIVSWQGKVDPPQMAQDPPQFLAYEGDNRLMVLVCHNNDTGDGWEQSSGTLGD